MQLQLTFPSDREIEQYEWDSLKQSIRACNDNIRVFEDEVLKQKAEIERLEGIMQRKREMEFEKKQERAEA